MMNEDPRMINLSQTTDGRFAVSGAFSKLMRNVYLWMTLALAITGLTAAYVSRDLQLLSMMSGGMKLGLVIAELVVVMVLSAAINRLSFPVAGLMFLAYSLLNGVTFSVILQFYTHTSIATTFLVTAGTFGAMTLVGFFIKKDLSAMGRILMMALIGIIIATVVNMFVASSVLDWALTYLGVAVFVGLTAYDTQKIRNIMLVHGHEVNDSTMKLALMCSLTLYLDFINLFLYLLRIFGDRK